MISRRRFMQGLGTGAACLAGAGLVDGLFIEPSRLVVERIEAKLLRLPPALDGLKIAQLSDFHYKSSLDGELIWRAVDLANQLAPDMIVLTGDYVDAFARPHPGRNATPCAQILGCLKAHLGVFGILGNHDDCDPKFVGRALERQGVALLRNRSVFVERSGVRLWIAGVEDVLAGSARLEEALRPIPPGEVTVLLAHEPDYADTVKEFPVDLQLSGHSHGGQIRVPFAGPIYLPPMARKYPSGLRQLGRLSLYTNRGLGTTFFHARFDATPEVTLTTLRSVIR